MDWHRCKSWPDCSSWEYLGHSGGTQNSKVGFDAHGWFLWKTAGSSWFGNSGASNQVQVWAFSLLSYMNSKESRSSGMLCCHMPDLNPNHILGVFWACSHEERPNAMRNMSRIWPRTGSAYYWINWAMAIVVVGKCSEGKVASQIPKIESKCKYFYFACQISITSQNNWASWFN